MAEIKTASVTKEADGSDPPPKPKRTWREWLDTPAFYFTLIAAVLGLVGAAYTIWTSPSTNDVKQIASDQTKQFQKMQDDQYKKIEHLLDDNRAAVANDSIQKLDQSTPTEAMSKMPTTSAPVPSPSPPDLKTIALMLRPADDDFTDATATLRQLLQAQGYMIVHEPEKAALIGTVAVSTNAVGASDNQIYGIADIRLRFVWTTRGGNALPDIAATQTATLPTTAENPYNEVKQQAIDLSLKALVSQFDTLQSQK